MTHGTEIPWGPIVVYYYPILRFWDSSPTTFRWKSSLVNANEERVKVKWYLSGQKTANFGEKAHTKPLYQSLYSRRSLEMFSFVLFSLPFSSEILCLFLCQIHTQKQFELASKMRGVAENKCARKKAWWAPKKLLRSEKTASRMWSTFLLLSYPFMAHTEHSELLIKYCQCDWQVIGIYITGVPL